MFQVSTRTIRSFDSSRKDMNSVHSKTIQCIRLPSKAHLALYLQWKRRRGRSWGGGMRALSMYVRVYIYIYMPCLACGVVPVVLLVVLVSRLLCVPPLWGGACGVRHFSG